MNINLVEMYNGLLRFNKHILNELAEGLKHLPSLDGAFKGDSCYINEEGNPAWGSPAFIPTFENAAYGIEWTKNNNDVIRIGNAKFHRELPIQNRLKGCVYNEKKISYFLNPTGWAKPLENGFVPPLDGSDGDVGVNVPQFYMCVKDTGTKYQLWISDFNIDGTFTRVHPFIISHTKTMTRIREDGVEEVFSACITKDNTNYIGGNRNSNFVNRLYGRPRSGITYDKAVQFCANRGDWITIIDYLEWCALQTLYYIEYASFNSQDELNINLTSEGFKQGGLGQGVNNLDGDLMFAYNGKNPIVETYWSAEHNIGNNSSNGDGYILENFNSDGSNKIVYPVAYRGILNIFGDLMSIIRDVILINKDTNWNYVYILKKGINRSDVTLDNINEKCYLIGHQKIKNAFICEWDFQRGVYYIPSNTDMNKKNDGNWGTNSTTELFVLLVGGRRNDYMQAGIGNFDATGRMSWIPEDSSFFTTVKLD